MRKIYLSILIVLFFYPFIFAQNNESVTITTYYPSPYGSYHELHSDGIAIGSANRGTTPPADGATIQGNVRVGDTTTGIGLFAAGSNTVNCPASMRGMLRFNPTIDAIQYCAATGQWSSVGGMTSLPSYPASTTCNAVPDAWLCGFFPLSLYCTSTTLTLLPTALAPASGSLGVVYETTVQGTGFEASIYCQGLTTYKSIYNLGTASWESPTCQTTFVATDCGSGTGTCFVKGTKVYMADGSLKNIEDVKIDDIVLGKDGSRNKVLGYERPFIGKRTTYVINGEIEVTGDHPFLTAGGWKVNDVGMFNSMPRSLKEKPAKLKVGDRLIMREGQLPVSRIEEHKSRPAQETVYDLKLDGDHTYYVYSSQADEKTSNAHPRRGYLVHNCN